MVAVATLAILSAMSALPIAASVSLEEGLHARLVDIAAAKAAQYDCKIAIGVESHNLSVSTSSDEYIWGSVTKLATGTAVLQHVDDGTLALDARVAPILDPALLSLGLPPLEKLFGRKARRITVRHLATMMSGVPDYDTAKPYPRPPKDPFRAEVYKTPSAEYPPASLINQSWVATGYLEFGPGEWQDYSSTNFVLLGLLLARLGGAAPWDAYDQASILARLPDSRAATYGRLRFAAHGPPSRWTRVRGFDRTSYNGGDPTARPGKDVADVAGVFAGWTASDITAPVADVARLAYDIFGLRGPRLLSRSSVDEMIPTSPFYGLATFNLSGLSGASSAGPDRVAYGHLGATYGYQSIVAYFPGADVSISVASNIEMDEQAQPSDTMCLAANAALAAIRQRPEPSCTFSKAGYYGGICDCGNTYLCSPVLKKCVQDTYNGTLSREDCEQAC